jgi:hypothetical protein
VIRTRNQNQFVIPKWKRLQMRCGGNVADNTDIGHPLGHRLDSHAADVLLKIHANVWMAGQEFGQRLGQELDDGRDIGENPYLPANSGRKGPQIFIQLRRLIEHTAGPPEEGMSRRREANPFAAPRNQSRMKRSFEVGKPLADCRSHGVVLLRRSGNASRFGHRDEQFEVFEREFHGGMVWPNPL